MGLIIGYCCWVLVGIVSGWIWCWKMKKKMEDKNGVPKGNLGWPFIGETLDFIASGYTSRPVTFMDKRKSLYGKVFKTNILGTPIIVSTDPDVNKVVLQNHGNTFVPAYPKSIRELLGKSSILQINGNLQRRLHALLGGFLRSPQLKSRITKDIENSVKLTLSSWKHMNNLVYVQEETKKITFQILVKVLMSIGPGDDLNSLKKEFEEFIKGLICLPIKLPGTRLYKSLKAKEKMLKIVNRIVEERKLGMEMMSDHGDDDDDDQKSGAANDAVDVLLREYFVESNEKQSLPLDFISGNIVEMMIPGEETVPMAMTLAVKFLSDSPVALKQLMEENMEMKKQKIESCDDYTWTDYTSLSFTQNVRYLIPQGWCVLTSFTSVHMDEENYENPYHFDPWRWEKIGGGAVNNNNYTPFGGGQRLCPGLDLSRLEISIFLHHLVTTYGWVAEKDDIVHFPTVKMKKKLPITVAPIRI
ncbi:hypothetical protein EZV62_014307 [Acer yangbiense]|uniref:Cytochrome P450 n=1 Tax=Acer yangbiense TaxID=1000413 RepID=A0A5C7HSA3_9ROSI|nr:hypothetical protein EZV62_014307 [Acer yangbiense]